MTTNPWLARRVINYAHQGGSWERPSSTLAAIAHALEAGATAIELDVHATGDRQLVVCHDATVDRTTGVSGRIAEMTLEEVQALDPAYWFVPGVGEDPDRPADRYPLRGQAPQDTGLRIPTLREVLETFPGVVLNLDIKATGPVVEPYEALLAGLLREHERRDDVIVASFLDSATETFRRHAPEIPVSAGTVATAHFWRSVRDGKPTALPGCVALQVPEARGDLTIVDEAFVEAAHDRELAVHVWTVNDAGSVRRLLDMGVDGVITDLPTMLAGVLAEEGLTWSRT